MLKFNLRLDKNLTQKYDQFVPKLKFEDQPNFYRIPHNQ